MRRPAAPTAPSGGRRRALLRVALLLALAGAVAVFFALGLQRSFTLEGLRANERHLLTLTARHPLAAACAYLLLYVAVAALSVPGDIPLTVAAGALFGLGEGTVLASFGSTTGATLAFLATRFLFRDAVRRKFPARLARIDRGLARGGGTYLLSLRLVPAVPFVLVNILFGVTGFPAWRFYWISQAGMLPATLAYVNAGTQLGRLHSLSGILTLPVLVSLLLLAALPLAARALSALLMRTR